MIAVIGAFSVPDSVSTSGHMSILYNLANGNQPYEFY